MYGNPTFGQWIKQRRQALDLTHRELAAQLACSVSLLRKFEAGERRPPLQTAQRMAELLAIPADQRGAFLSLARGEPPAPPPAAPHRAGGVPSPPNPLIGRAGDLATIHRMLAATGARLLTLLGPPGVGKTRLAQRLAADLAPAFAHEVTYVALAPLQSAEQVLPAIGLTLGLPERADRPIDAQLAEHFGARQALLVLDNIEHLLDAAPQLADLLAASPGLTLICTSQAALRIRAERIYRVPPLGLPAENEGPTSFAPGQLAAIAAAPAVQLLIDRAQAADPGFALHDANAAAIARICIGLDGLPLAIELAAAQITRMPAERLLDQLDRRLALLSDGPRDLPVRQQTLRGAIAWSYDLLGDDERQALAQLAVFAGGWTGEAAAAIVALSERRDLAALIGTLQLRSLVQPSAPAGGVERATMLESIRAFALDQLGAAAAAELRRRHASYYAALAERAGPEVQGPQAAGWIEQLEAEINNLRAAQAWSLDHDGGQIAARIAVALLRFYQVRGLFSEGRRWIEPVLMRTPLNDWREATTIAPHTHVEWHEGGRPLREPVRPQPMRPLPPEADPRRWPPLLWARASYAVGFLASQQGDIDCYGLIEQSVALFRTLDDAQGLIRALNGLGMVHRWPGAFPLARSLFTEALALQRGQAGGLTNGATMGQIGLLELEVGNYAAAEAAFHEAIAIDSAQGWTGTAMRYLPDLAEVAFRSGDTARAIARYEQALAGARAHSDREVVAESLHGLGIIATARGDLAEAAEQLEASLAIYREMGLTFAIIRVLVSLGYLALRRDAVDQARAHFAESLQIAIYPGQVEPISQALNGMALVADAMGRAADAARLADAAADHIARFQLRPTPWLPALGRPDRQGPGAGPHLSPAEAVQLALSL